MRVFLAGATGVIGSRLVPLLLAAGHQVAGLTRDADQADRLATAGVRPVVGDVFDAPWLTAAMVDFAPEAVLHELTSLPKDAADLPRSSGANARIRREGTRNLLAGAAAAGASRFAAQSVAWPLKGDGAAAVADLERMVLAADGVVIRYGRFYGPGTYHPDHPPEPPRIHVDEAARRTLPALDLRATVLTLTEDA
jgi:uncharacterized protein YbjT (DUF2867 family)